MKRFLAILTLAVAVAPAEAAAEFDAAGATNEAGLDLYRQLSAKRPDGNLVISPYSIESALALVYVGAEAETRTELAGVFRFPATDAAVQAGFAALRGALEQVAKNSQAAAETRSRNGGRVDSIEWHAANRLFGQEGYAFRESFLTLMKDGFVAPFQPMDFIHAAEASRGTINAWVEEQTRQKIRDLIPRDALNRDTRLVLVNALYLKAPWETPFGKTLTQPRPFHVGGKPATRDVPTMQATAFLGHAAESGFTVTTVDYLGGDLQFLILLPDANQTVADIAQKIAGPDFARWAGLGRQKRPSVSLFLPKFRVEGATVPLGETLRALGVKRAFDEPRGSANFDRMAPRRPDDYLALSNVFHQTFIALDEEGTEAAAATAAVMIRLTSAMPPPTPVEVRVDRPFLFAIQHRASGACLFLGRITEPK
ncbi:MAG TPA: serpin family protein [Opitutaceae bacterium]|nr:serpin family protein [Opitutaceae bacterium]